MGSRQPIEDKSLKNTFFDKNFKRYCFNFCEHGNYYNFYDSRELVSEFLMKIPQPNLRQVCFKYSFTIINCQPAPITGFVENTDSRVWQTNVCDGFYFNDFVKSGTRYFEKGNNEWHDR